MTAKMSYHIDAPVESVFAYFRDPTQTEEFPGYEVRDLKETKEGVGTHYSWHAKLGVIPMHGFNVYTEYEPNKHLTERSSNPMVGTWDYRFEPEGTGTRITMEHTSQSVWGVPPVRNLVDYMVPRMSQGFIGRVKEKLESTEPSPRKSTAGKTRKAAARS